MLSVVQQTFILCNLAVVGSFYICMPKTKYYVFTINNYTGEEEELLQRLVGAGTATYLIYGRETGDRGTPHLQGYVEFKTRKTVRTVKRLGGFVRAHLEQRRGTSDEAAEYCRKDGDVWEEGERSSPHPGSRSDLQAALMAVQEGASVRELWTSHATVMVRYSRGVLEYRDRTRPPKLLQTFELSSFGFACEFECGKAHIVVGPSGCGKTSYARSRFPKALMVTHMDDLLKFVAEEHEAIIFDDMCFTHLPRTSQIHLVDWDDDRSIHCRYACATIPRNTMKIFTTNVEYIFELNDAAIARRVKVHRVE